MIDNKFNIGQMVSFDGHNFKVCAIALSKKGCGLTYTLLSSGGSVYDARERDIKEIEPEYYVTVSDEDVEGISHVNCTPISIATIKHAKRVIENSGGKIAKLVFLTDEEIEELK